jgi:hypothetical protein
LSRTTSYGSVPSPLTSANTYLALSRPWPSRDRGCPFVTVVRQLLLHVDRTPRRVGALMVFKSVRNSSLGSIATWTFSGPAHRASQDHPVYIPRDLNLLISRFPCGRPAPFRSVRDLKLVSAGCPCWSARCEGRSSAWLPAARDAGHRDALVLHQHRTFDRRGDRALSCSDPPPNPTAAVPGDGRVRSRPSSRVHEPGSLPR